jgi:anaerobic magnesium-protoporphyrin IX monomethyl ester cyclase
MITAARRAGARVVAAGSDVTDAPSAYLEAGADFVLIGEGLAALMQAVRRLDQDPGADTSSLLEGLPGVASLAGGEMMTSNGARVLPNPDLAEMAAWDLVDMERYRAVWRRAHGYFSLNMAASRGCSFRCAWCAKPIWGNQYLQRGAATVAAEMTHLKRTYQAEHIWFADDIFGFRVDWVSEFSAAVRASNGSLPFMIQVRADLTGERMARELREAGCVEAWIGAESGSQRVLDAMNKGTTVPEILAARARLKMAGIRVGFFIQLGYLGEELEDILATRRLIENARPDDVGVSVAYPLPGTKFYEVVREQLGDKTHWTDSGDLAMMFQGTYRSEFYRAVRDLLHDQVSVERLNTDHHVTEYRRGKRLLERQWNQLLATEVDYRTNPGSGTAAAV